MKTKGITAILSIQTDEDFLSHQLNPDYFSLLCEENGLEFYSCAIEDKNKVDFLEKWTEGVSLLRKLLKKGHVVYVHCSAGVYRSPQIVVLYLIIQYNITPAKAIAFVRSRHRFARPSESLIMRAFSSLGDGARKSKSLFV